MYDVISWMILAYTALSLYICTVTSIKRTVFAKQALHFLAVVGSTWAKARSHPVEHATVLLFIAVPIRLFLCSLQLRKTVSTLDSLKKSMRVMYGLMGRIGVARLLRTFYAHHYFTSPGHLDSWVPQRAKYLVRDPVQSILVFVDSVGACILVQILHFHFSPADVV